MANKKSVKKKVVPQGGTPTSSASNAKAAPKKAAASKKAAKAKKNGKPGFFSRVKSYIASVRSEMKRVVWPSKKELINYSIAVCASLVVVGVVIAVLDLLIGEGLVLFSGLRG